MTRTAFLAGSFDPMTNGHLHLVEGGLAIADRLVIGIGVHPSKPGLFSFEERKALIEACLCAEDRERMTVIAFSGLLVEAARAEGASLILRGLRDGTDLDYEMQLAGMNGELDSTLRTLFLPARPAHRHITATLVRQIAAMGGDVGAFVPAAVAAALADKRRA